MILLSHNVDGYEVLSSTYSPSLQTGPTKETKTMIMQMKEQIHVCVSIVSPERCLSWFICEEQSQDAYHSYALHVERSHYRLDLGKKGKYWSDHPHRWFKGLKNSKIS